MNEKHDRLVGQVRKWLCSQGYEEAGSLQDAPPCVCVDAVFRKAGAPLLLVEAKVVDTYRSQVFPAMVGDAILRFERAAPGQELLLACMLRRVGRRAASDLHRYAEGFRPDLNWFVVDERGSGFTRLHEFSGRVSVQPPVPEEPRSAGPPKGTMFSSNNQWLLKVLLLRGLDGKYWEGPRDEPGSFMDLARISGVPQPSVSKFVARFEKAGFLQRTERGPRIRRHRELLEDWFHAEKQGRHRAIGMRSMYGEDSEEGLLARVGEYARPYIAAGRIAPVAVSHHLACHLLGVGRSTVRSALLHASTPLDEVLSALDLVRDESDSPPMSIRWSPSASHVLRGAVVSDGVPVCDLLQCYLDVRSSRARGEEQARYLLDKVLMPHFEGAA